MDKRAIGFMSYLKSRVQFERNTRELVCAGKKRWRNRGKRCPCCDELISYEKRRNNFCSHTCATRFVNGKRGKKAPVHCAVCCTLTKNAKYCSRGCFHTDHYRRFVASWLSGQDSGIRVSGMATSTYIKRWLIETRGEACEICEWHERHPVTGRVPVQLSHEDGNSQNNAPENLKLRCPNCHSLTSTFGALNKGNGRSARYH